MTTATASRPRCWVCESTDTVPWKKRDLARDLAPEDLRITDSRYGVTLSLRRCRECGFIFAADQEVDRLLELYEDLSDPGYEESQGPRVLQMRWLLDSALRFQPAARSVLDVGAGSGLLVAEAARTGLRAVGVEPSGTLVILGMRSNNAALIQGTLPHPALEGERFDLVFLVNVIEHVSRPVTLLRACADALSPEGCVVVVTPDMGSIAARLLGRRWWHLRLAHVGYFHRTSLARAARTAGLVPIHEDRARWFFRVSYVAERVSAYLPVDWLNRLAVRLPPLHWLYDRVIRVNLHDSFVASPSTMNASRLSSSRGTSQWPSRRLWAWAS